MSTPNITAHLVKKLRQLMKDASFVPKALHAYIIPSCDAHQSEYTAECDQRRAFISGFTGSMGTAIVTDTAAALWTDGRYYLQAQQELDQTWVLMKEGQHDTLREGPWLVNHFKGYMPQQGCVVGVDPLLLDQKCWVELEKELLGAGHQLVAVTSNLVDVVWGADKPQRPNNPVLVHDKHWTGKSHIDKINELRNTIKQKDCYAVVLTALDDVAYLLNMRGSDIPYNPLFFSYMIVTLESVTIFVDVSKLTAEATQHLQQEPCPVEVAPYEDLLPRLTQVCSSVPPGQFVWLPTTCSQAVVGCVPPHQRRLLCTPVALPRAVKNPTEIQGLEACHVRDGAALCSFLAWLEQEAPQETQTEMSAAAYLEQCRAKQDNYRGLSFETITAVGSNAAITHYRTSPATNRTVTTRHIYLVDSGAHYSDGTTDVTRTLHFGEPTAAERDAFTRVLKGHIALATAVFPPKIKGNRLDSFARQFLWSVGLDYGHGTGHGIGMFLNVHEGPMGIGWRTYPDDPGLEEGMFLSDEPGYYKAGEFGIRIESIVRVVKADTPHRHNDQDFLTFKVVTLAPIQAKLIDVSLLTNAELDWLNAYHETVRKEVGAVLSAQRDQRALEWLMRETVPIARLA
ncbi:xaa-Pro aminopeptidase 1 [Hyalella azteca]|uniref:Xaa-Pro aminopeptidase 1 n=1 Tax=Hyalella azteca TaxID=294128 RepID=A0A8B7P2Z0_HYAAZ|nr:xaa-Pro aminopeptidase 1 [Hyalella azteca]